MLSMLSPPVPLWAGITVGLLASFVQSLGLTIQRKSHLDTLSSHIPIHHRPLWLFGLALFVLSNLLGSLFQIAALPVVLLGPLGAVSLLSNALFAKLLLHVSFPPAAAGATLLIAAGAVLIAIFGVVDMPSHDLDALLKLFARPPFLVYLALLVTGLAAVLIPTHLVEFSLRASQSAAKERELEDNASFVASTEATEITNERTPLIDRKSASSPSPAPSLFSSASSITAPQSRTNLLLAIAYASASGTLSGTCLLFAKSSAELLVLTLSSRDGTNQFLRWESWVLLVVLVILALLQLWYLHKSLVFADPTIVCPLAFCFYNLSSITSALIYYNQFSLLPTSHLLLVALGTVVLLAGVWLVSLKSGSAAQSGVGVDAVVEDPQVEVIAQNDVEQTIIIEESEPESETATATPQQPSSSASTSAQQTTLGHGVPPYSPQRPRQRHVSDTTASRRPSRILTSSGLGQRYDQAPHSAHFHPPSHSQSHSRMSTTSTGLRSPSALSTGIGFSLSIGLSAASPGFALVPSDLPQSRSAKGMKASISSNGTVGGPSGSGEGSRSRSGLRLPKIMRRTMSEGDVEGREDRSLHASLLIHNDQRKPQQEPVTMGTVEPSPELVSSPPPMTTSNSASDMNAGRVPRWRRGSKSRWRLLPGFGILQSRGWSAEGGRAGKGPATNSDEA